MAKKTYSGYTPETAQSLLLDAGAFFVNYEVETDDFESAIKAGKLLGATSGGGEFKAVPTIRQIEVDGIKGKTKGLEVIDAWDTSIKANVLEVTRESIAKALCASDIDSSTNDIYDIITARNFINLTDYMDNVTWVGTLSGSDEPVIIQVFNTINLDGLTLTTTDKNQAVIAMTFNGHYTDTTLDMPPFKIYYPKTIKE